MHLRVQWDDTTWDDIRLPEIQPNSSKPISYIKEMLNSKTNYWARTDKGMLVNLGRARYVQVLPEDSHLT